MLKLQGERVYLAALEREHCRELYEDEEYDGVDAMNPIPLGVYRHYKGNLYEVTGFARHSETLEDMVIYKALYGHPAP